MKCSRCGKTFRDIGALGKHYRKSHPLVLKRKKATSKKKSRSGYCHACGKKL